MLSDARYMEEAEGFWRTSVGDVLPVRAMGAKHLRNAIRLMEREYRADRGLRWYARHVRENLDLVLRGKVAPGTAWRRLRARIRPSLTLVYPKHSELVEERDRRDSRR